MAIDIMMQLGGFQFSINTAAYETLSRSTGWRWPTQAQIGKRDARQYTGKADDTITLAGSIYPSFRNAGTGQLDQMRALGDRGLPLQLVDGRGYLHGLWVITSVRERQPRHVQGGAPRKQEFTLELAKYDDRAVL